MKIKNDSVPLSVAARHLVRKCRVINLKEQCQLIIPLWKTRIWTVGSRLSENNHAMPCHDALSFDTNCHWHTHTHTERVAFTSSSSNGGYLFCFCFRQLPIYVLYASRQCISTTCYHIRYCRCMEITHSCVLSSSIHSVRTSPRHSVSFCSALHSVRSLLRKAAQ